MHSNRIANSETLSLKSAKRRNSCLISLTSPCQACVKESFSIFHSGIFPFGIFHSWPFFGRRFYDINSPFIRRAINTFFVSWTAIHC